MYMHRICIHTYIISLPDIKSHLASMYLLNSLYYVSVLNILELNKIPRIYVHLFMSLMIPASCGEMPLNRFEISTTKRNICVLNDF